MGNLIITNALIIAMTERVSFYGYVRVRDGAIAEVGAGAPPETAKDEETARRLGLRAHAWTGQRSHPSLSSLAARGVGRLGVDAVAEADLRLRPGADAGAFLRGKLCSVVSNRSAAA